MNTSDYAKTQNELESDLLALRDDLNKTFSPSLAEVLGNERLVLFFNTLGITIYGLVPKTNVWDVSIASDKGNHSFNDLTTPELKIVIHNALNGIFDENDVVPSDVDDVMAELMLQEGLKELFMGKLKKSLLTPLPKKRIDEAFGRAMVLAGIKTPNVIPVVMYEKYSKMLDEVLPPGFSPEGKYAKILASLKQEYGHDDPLVYKSAWHIYNNVLKEAGLTSETINELLPPGFRKNHPELWGQIERSHPDKIKAIRHAWKVYDDMAGSNVKENMGRYAQLAGAMDEINDPEREEMDKHLRTLDAIRKGTKNVFGNEPDAVAINPDDPYNSMEWHYADDPYKKKPDTGFSPEKNESIEESEGGYREPDTFDMGDEGDSENPNRPKDPRKHFDLMTPEYRAKKEKELLQKNAKQYLDRVMFNARMKAAEEERRRKKEMDAFDPVIEEGENTPPPSGMNRKDRRDLHKKLMAVDTTAADEKAKAAAEKYLSDRDPSYKTRKALADKQKLINQWIADMKAKKERGELDECLGEWNDVVCKYAERCPECEDKMAFVSKFIQRLKDEGKIDDETFEYLMQMNGLDEAITREQSKRDQTGRKHKEGRDTRLSNPFGEDPRGTLENGNRGRGKNKDHRGLTLEGKIIDGDLLIETFKKTFNK